MATTTEGENAGADDTTAATSPTDFRSSAGSPGSGGSPAPGGVSSSELRAGSVLAGRYRVGDRLGRGGMGEVHEAFDLALNEAVALKVIKPELARSESMLRRFKREVLLARSVTHRQVCRIFDIGHHNDETGSTYFITMELLRGESLKVRIAKRGRLAPAEALPLVRQMAMGLEAAHRSGIVHRDFKCANVMLVKTSSGERAVVTDFGLAQLAGPGDDGPASMPDLAGTVAYMAPEQVRGELLTPSADIYAFGVVLFEMVTGCLPFLAPTFRAMAEKRLTEDPPAPSSLEPGLDPRWEQVILRCLRRDPAERFARVEEVVEALEGGDAVTAKVRRDGLPAERNRFVGREEERRAIALHFESGARLITLVGPGGMGKTRLAARHGRLAAPAFPGGVWFSDLTEARSVEGIASAVSIALDVPLGRGDPIAELGHAVAGRGAALFILDNFEQVQHLAPVTLARWLERAPEGRFLVTSRERLHLEGEVVQVIEPLASAEAIELFADRARAARPGFTLDEATSESVRRVVSLLEGLPLAIELAAARTAVMTPERLVERIQDRFRLLATAKERGRHGSLRAAIDGSWETLAPWEKDVLAQASVFEGGFTLEAAEAVFDIAGHAGAPWIVDVVQALVDKSLLRTWVPEGTYGEPRFGMYVSIQEYAREKLREDGDGLPRGDEAELRAQARHGRHYARFGMPQARESLALHGGAERVRALAREVENVLVATERAVRRDDGETATFLFGATWEILELKGPVGAAVDLGERLLAVSGLDEGCRGRGLRDLGRACWRAGRMEEARDRYSQALAIARNLGERRLEGVVLGDLGTLCMSQGGMKEASEYYASALAMHRAEGDRLYEGIVLGNLGILCGAQGRADESRRYYEWALAIHREVGNRLFEGIVLGNLGGLSGQQGRWDEARASSEGALAIYRELGARRAEGTVLGNIGNLDWKAGQIEDAFGHFERALEIHRSVGNLHGEGIVLGYLGSLHLRRGRLEVARELFQEAERLVREMRDGLELGKLLCARAEAEAQGGEVALAGRCLGEAESLAVACGASPSSELGREVARVALSLRDR